MMTLKTRWLLCAITAASISLTSCNQYQKAKSGMMYKIEKGDGRVKVKHGDVVKFNIEYKLQPKDTVLNSTFGKMPGYMKVDTGKLPGYNFTELLPLLSVGDKAEFSLSVDSLVNKKMVPAYDRLFVKGGAVKGRIQIIKTYTSDSLANADYMKDMAIENEKEQKKIEKETTEATAKEKDAIAKYVSKNNFKGVPAAQGVLVQVDNAGEGPKADSGMQAMVKYKGYTLDGKVFDENMSDKATHKDPIAVNIGEHSVIQGWEIGLKYFGKGGKGKILVPFSVGYGAYGSPPAILKFATLVFDIEIVDLKKSEQPKEATLKPIAPVPNKAKK